MKSLKSIMLTTFGLILAATTLSGCMITEECTREGLTVYTKGWDHDWSSTCIGGYWIDSPNIILPENVNNFFIQNQNCTVVACYEADTHECECTDDFYDSGRTPASHDDTNPLTKAEIQQTIRDAGDQLRACYSSAENKGTMNLSFTIKGNGSVCDVTVTSSEFAGTSVAECVLNVFSNLIFRATGGSDTPIHNYPVAVQ